MKKLLLKSVERTVIGKNSAKALRREGNIPGNFYGPETKAVNLFVKSVDMQKIIKVGGNSQFLLDLELNSEIKKVTIKELQRHPVSGDILHIDFYEVAMDRKIRVNVPIITTGKSKGVEFGGMLQLIRREVEVLCLPDNIPDSIPVDITDLDIGDSIHIRNLLLPNEVEVFGESNFTILTILIQKKGGEESIDDLEKEIEETTEEVSGN